MSINKALDALRYLPRITLSNLRDNPLKKGRKVVKRNSKRNGQGHKGTRGHCSYYPIGYEGWRRTPFYMKIPFEPYYENHLRREYPPVSLKTLQLMIDTGRINPSEPIDLTTICNTKLYTFEPLERHYGIHLTDEGLDNFKAKVCIEVQHAKEHVIAAVERNGGVIVNAFYDMVSLLALRDPEHFFKRGVPIPLRTLPPEDALEFYMDSKSRGYLADPDKIAEQRFSLAQKYGYEFPDISKDPDMMNMLKFSKDPRQVFFGLEAGWVVNLKDKTIMKPKMEKLKEFYSP